MTTTTRLAAGILTMSALALGACSSSDRHIFTSTEWSPKTITLFDTRTDEAVWSVDVPVTYKLVVAFEEGAGPNEYNPDIITWEVFQAELRRVALSNRQACPPEGSRILKMELRDTPEFPGTVQDPPAPAAE